VRKLPLGTKIAYGIGQVGEGIKSRGFDFVVFFYFTQVLGLSGSLAGIAVAIALVFDAFTDPIAGHLSDNWKSKGGRRHPFMYGAAIPLGLFWYLLFFPPDGLGQLGLFLWFLVFAILVRGAMTLYHVPHLALGAELSDDYVERTSIVQYRTFCGMAGSLGVIGFGIYTFFPESAGFSNGLLNPAGYPKFAAFSAVLMFLTIWYSAYGTRHTIPTLPKAPEHSEPFSVKATFDEFRLAWQNHSFRSLFLGFSLYAISISIGNTLGTHLNVFFWGFSAEQISILVAPVAIGFVLGVVISALLHGRFDKKPTLIVSCLVSGLVGQTAVVLRLAGVLPPDLGGVIFAIVGSLLVVLGIAAGIGYTSAGSMMADVAHDQFLRTGRNQQGILFSAVSFSGKLGSAGGHLVAGVGIDLIGFPLKEDPAMVAPYLVTRLGLLSLLAAPLAFTGIWAYTYYRITRSSYEASLQSASSAAAEGA
jgi:GPH family glycoside/pentoside/hexuronide:cation symporter